MRTFAHSPVILADAGPGIGLGHLGRCTAIAQGLVATRHEKPVFYLRDRVAAGWVEERGFGVIRSLPRKISLMIVDSYHSSLSDWSDYRKRAHRLLVIDDDGTVRTSPDWVLNSSPFAQRYSYARVPASGLMLGPLFHPLRREFWPKRQARPVNSTVRNILVMVGGGDHEGLASRLTHWVRDTLPAATIHVVAGPYTKPSAPDSGVIIHQSPGNIRKILERCDAAVSSAGQTLFELAACGIPTLAIQIVDNQRPNFRGFHDLRGVLAIGSIKARHRQAKLQTALHRVAHDLPYRQNLADTARSIVDGRGAMRVAHAIGHAC